MAGDGAGAIRVAGDRDGERRWVAYEAPGLGDSEQYGEIGAAFVATGAAAAGNIGSAASLVFGLRGLVDFATAHWRARPVGQY